MLLALILYAREAELGIFPGALFGVFDDSNNAAATDYCYWNFVHSLSGLWFKIISLQF